MNEIEKKIERLERLVKILFTEKRITDEAIASIVDKLDGENSEIEEDFKTFKEMMVKRR